MGKYSSTLSIQELVDEGTGRLLVLSGAGLPLQGAAWGGKQAMTTTWYPGNGTEATQQIFGPQEIPSQWEGEWHRTTLPGSGCTLHDDAGSTDIVNPHFLLETLEDIFRSGHLLRVTWSVSGSGASENVSIVREGRASDWNFPITRLQDIQWSVTFDWKGRGDQQRPISTRDENIPSASNTMSTALAQAILKIQALNVTSSPPSSFSLGQLDALASAPSAFAKGISRSFDRINHQVQELGDVIAKVKGTPFAIAQTAVTIARNALTTAHQFSDTISRRPPELLTLKARASDVARAASLFAQATDASDAVAASASDFEAKFRRVLADSRQAAKLSERDKMGTSNSDLLGVHITKQGDTPERVSSKWYGNADRGIDILRANRLPWHQPSFAPGIPLIIPRLASST